MRDRIAACILALTLAWSGSAHAQLVPVPCALVEGETVALIAARFGVTVDDLAELNRDTDFNTLGPGAVISVGFGEHVEHRVARGETLLRIARRYGVSATDIARWNELSDPRRLRADATLIIYAWPRIPPSSSIGRPSSGTLENGVQLRSGSRLDVHDSAHAYVTREAAAALELGFETVGRRWPDAPRVEIRDASTEHGGPLHGHHSHQSGRDIDLAYFRRGCGETCTHHRATPSDLDAEREWAVLETWLRAEVVDYIFIDRELQEPLFRAARANGVSATDLARWFQWPRGREHHAGLIRHADGHRDHLHVRFTCAAHDLACGPRRAEAEAP